MKRPLHFSGLPGQSLLTSDLLEIVLCGARRTPRELRSEWLGLEASELYRRPLTPKSVLAAIDRINQQFATRTLETV